MKSLIVFILFSFLISTTNTKALAQVNEVKPANYHCSYKVEEDVRVTIDIYIVQPGSSYIVYRSEELTQPVLAMVSDMYLQNRTLTLEGDMPYPAWPEGSTFKISLNLNSSYTYSTIWFKPYGDRGGLTMNCIRR